MSILVIGDVMLDIHRIGFSKRNSPESPNCPVITDILETYEPGGAANVAAWLSACPNTEIDLIGIYTNDNAGITLDVDLNRKWKVELLDCLYYPFFSEYYTTTKERIGIADASRRNIIQVARCDNDTNIITDELSYDAIKEYIRENNISLIVIADYQKSVFRGEWGRKLKDFLGNSAIPIIVNSKRPDKWAEYPVDILICNASEAKNAWGNYNIGELFKKIKSSMLIITKSSEGIEAIYNDEMPLPNIIKMKSLVHNPVDVTGCGDAFTAGIAARFFELINYTIDDPAGREQTILSILHDGQKWAASCCGKFGCGAPIKKG